MIDERGLVELLVSSAGSTAKVEKIVVNNERGKHKYRGPLNVLLYGSFGTIKTTILNAYNDFLDELARKQGIKVKHEKISSWTFPGLFGTIRDGRFNKGALLKVPNGVLISDEIDSVDDISLDLMLPLLQDGEASRSIGYHVLVPFKKRGKNFKCIVKDGTMYLRENFSVVAASNNTFKKNDKKMALLSRFAIIQKLGSIEEMYSVMKYGVNLNFFYVDMPSCVEWTKDVFGYLTDRVYKETNTIFNNMVLGLKGKASGFIETQLAGLMGRCTEHTVKVLSVVSVKNNMPYPNKEMMKTLGMNLYKTLLFNGFYSFRGIVALSDTDYEIARLYYNNVPVVDIANILNRSRVFIENRITYLKRIGFINKLFAKELEEKQELPKEWLQ